MVPKYHLRTSNRDKVLTRLQQNEKERNAVHENPFRVVYKWSMWDICGALCAMQCRVLHVLLCIEPHSFPAAPTDYRDVWPIAVIASPRPSHVTWRPLASAPREEVRLARALPAQRSSPSDLWLEFREWDPRQVRFSEICTVPASLLSSCDSVTLLQHENDGYEQVILAYCLGHSCGDPIPTLLTFQIFYLLMSKQDKLRHCQKSAMGA